MSINHSERSSIQIDLKQQNIDFILGCTDDVIKSVKSYSIEKNQVEIGFANNLIELIFPYNVDMHV